MSEKTIRELRQKIEQLKRQLDQRPVFINPSSTPKYRTVWVDRGNTLDTGQLGVLYEANVNTVPSEYDPDATSSFVSGIGRGTLYINGVAQDGYVLIVNDNRGSFRNALIQGDVIFAGGPVNIPVTGGGSVLAYTAG